MKINAFFAAVAFSALMTSCTGGAEKVQLFNGTDLSGWEFILAEGSDVPATTPGETTAVTKPTDTTKPVDATVPPETTAQTPQNENPEE